MSFQRRFGIYKAVKNKIPCTILWHPSKRITDYVLKKHIKIQEAKYKKDHGLVIYKGGTND